MRNNTSKNNSSYDKDFYLWSIQQADLLRKGEYTKIDLENVIEEIESLSKREKRSLKSQLRRLIHHLLKLKYAEMYKGNSNSWEGSIRESRQFIKDLLEDSPSLKNELKALFKECYEDGLELAIDDSCCDETLFPRECPWTIEEILGE